MESILDSAIRNIGLGRSLLFVGAGFSKAASNIAGTNMLLGAELAAYLGEALQEKEIPDLETISGMYIDTVGRSELLKVLCREFRCSNVTEAQRTVLSLPWKTIYTTNYDNVIERCLTDLQIDHHVALRHDRIRDLPDDKLHCVHLNGHIDHVNEKDFDENILLTDYQYFTSALMDSPWATKLRTDIHISRNVFFVGYSLADFEITKILFESSVTGKKLFFIQHQELGRAQTLKLERFGTVFPIGVETFASKIVSNG